MRRKTTRRAAIHQFCDLSEQRYQKGRAPLHEFTLEYNRLATVDKEILRSFYRSQAGQAGTSWSFALEGVTYPRCQFIAGSFEQELESAGVWTVTVGLRCFGVPTS